MVICLAAEVALGTSAAQQVSQSAPRARKMVRSSGVRLGPEQAQASLAATLARSAAAGTRSSFLLRSPMR